MVGQQSFFYCSFFNLFLFFESVHTCLELIVLFNLIFFPAHRKYRVTGSETPSNPGGVSEEFKRKNQQREKDRREQGVYASSKEDKNRDGNKSRDHHSERGIILNDIIFLSRGNF